MRVLFMGTPAAAVPCLDALAASSHSVVGVTCQPDRPSGRGRSRAQSPVKARALELELPLLQPESTATAEFREAVGALVPDVFVVVAYGRILGPRLLALAPRGAVNVHFSLLPRWRGASPVQRAILAGDAVTGVSSMQLVRELDAGPVLLAEELPVLPRESAGRLERRLALVGAALLLRTLDGLAAGTLAATPQDAAGVTLAPPLTKSDGDLDVERTAGDLERQVLALDPWPGTRLFLPGGGPLAVLDAEAVPAERTDAAPGTWLEPRGNDLPLACGQGSVLLVRLARPAGRAAMSGRSLVNGRVVKPGGTVERQSGRQDTATTGPGGPPAEQHP